METNVEIVDFGRENRGAARKMSRLLGIAAEFEADLLANPRKYYNRAVDEIVRLQTILRGAREALYHHPALGLAPYDESVCPGLPGVISVDKREYERLRAMERVIRDADLTATKSEQPTA